MKKLILIMLVTAAPASGQSRVYTNADLGRPLVSSERLSPTDAAAIMAAHQTIFPASVAADGPRVFVMDSRAGDGAFGPLRPFWPARRLDGTDQTQPLDLYGQPFGWYGAYGGTRSRSGMSRGAGPTSRRSAAGRTSGGRHR